MFSDDGWLSPEDQMALDDIERLDSYSELDEHSGALATEKARWGEEDEDVDEDGW